MATESGPTPINLQEILREGARIAAILLFWGFLAGIGRFGIGNIGYARPGSLFFELGNAIAFLFIATGLASVLIYVIARGIQLSRR
ncbi:hypothetical protein [Natronorubrum sp. FCH18a]|uniref:hypothetical protein n=1 Tax=Natronorubrum sp. FCH18a TaxID=3447018 RepID=UPI003F5159EA